MNVRTIIFAVAGSLAWLTVQATDLPATTAPVLDRADLETWLDGYFQFALKSSDMAGAVIVVVKDGAVLLQKGYGYADVAAKKPFDVTSTLVRAASISKTFTGTAVMQLVEQGKLDLDVDVNQYLDFKIPYRYGPVTLRNLLTHTPGFQDIQKGSTPNEPKWLKPIGTYLRTHVPEQIFPPGETPAYSNYGIALAGYIVERISGEPFEEYLEQHIFQPLGMEHTTCRQPVPERFSRAMAKVYRTASGPPKHSEFTSWRGAGCIITSAPDMAPFMAAHLQEGRYGDIQILRPQTARLMHKRAFGAIPRVNGMALVFFQEDRNGRRIIGHDGDLGFHSSMHLFLDDNVGFFASFNSDGANTAVHSIRQGLFEEFTDRYFPAPVPEENTVPTAVEHARMAAGTYEFSRQLSGILNIFMMFNQMSVTANDDGTVTIPWGATGEPKVFHEVGPLIWRSGQDLAGMKAQDGRVHAVYIDPAITLLRAPFWRSGSFVLPIVAGTFVVLLLTILAWPVAALVRRHYGKTLQLAEREVKLRRWARMAALTNLLFLGSVFGVPLSLLSRFYLFNDPLDPWLRLLQLIGLLGAVGTGVVLWNAWIVCTGLRGWAVKAWGVLLAVACLVVTWLGFTFDIITVRLHY
jgi:CubicO group peptidase (beta-lactamase class C family)